MAACVICLPVVVPRTPRTGLSPVLGLDVDAVDCKLGG